MPDLAGRKICSNRQKTVTRAPWHLKPGATQRAYHVFDSGSREGGSARATGNPGLGNEARGGVFPAGDALAAPLALAASLLLAVGAGGFLAGRALAPAGGAADPGAVAAAGLAGLGTGAGMDLAAGGEARVLGSYRTDRGLCRLIELAQPDGRAERAVVCRDPARDWAVVATVAAGRTRDYIPASDTAAALIELVLDDLGAGPALTPAEEAAALAD